MPDTDLPAGHRGTTDPAREADLLRVALCRCSQQYGQHNRLCPTQQLSNPLGRALIEEALEAHDRRAAVEAEAFCCSCGESLDPANMLRVNGIPYHLGNCPRPHGERGNDDPRPAKPPGDDPRAGNLFPEGPAFL